MEIIRRRPTPLERGLCEGIHQDELDRRDEFEELEGLHPDASWEQTQLPGAEAEEEMIVHYLT